jgi:hypothetical protein
MVPRRLGRGGNRASGGRNGVLETVLGRDRRPDGFGRSILREDIGGQHDHLDTREGGTDEQLARERVGLVPRHDFTARAA